MFIFFLMRVGIFLGLIIISYLLTNIIYYSLILVIYLFILSIVYRYYTINNRGTNKSLTTLFLS